MKYFFALLVWLWVSVAMAAGIPQFNTAVGLGVANSSFGAVAPGSAGQSYVSNGASANPSFQNLTAAQMAAILAANNTWSGTNTSSGDVYSGSGRPWVDVRAEGAAGNGSTIDTAAFNSAQTILATLGGGTLYLPPGNYCTPAFVLTSQSVRIVGAGGSNGGSIMNSCGSDATPLDLDGFADTLEHVYVVGPGFSAPNTPPTHPAMVVDTGCVECFILDDRMSGGTFPLLLDGVDYWIEKIHAESGYGNAIVKMGGISSGTGGYMIRAKLDQLFANGCNPGAGTTFTTWAATHSYAACAIAQVGSYLLQTVAGGTSGSSTPAVLSYGSSIADGTVTWQLLAPAVYSSLDVDSNTFSSYISLSDHTGPFSAAIVVQNSLPGSAPQSVYFDGITVGQAFQEDANLKAGNDVRFVNSQFGPCIGSGCKGIQTTSVWADGLSVLNSTIFLNPTGIIINAGTNTLIEDDQISGASTAAIDVEANVSKFVISGNNLGSSTAWGPNALSLVIKTGSGDYFNVTNNITNGATPCTGVPTCINDGASGSHTTTAGNN